MHRNFKNEKYSIIFSNAFFSEKKFLGNYLVFYIVN